jgi:hypothetical protein
MLGPAERNQTLGIVYQALRRKPLSLVVSVNAVPTLGHSGQLAPIQALAFSLLFQFIR